MEALMINLRAHISDDWDLRDTIFPGILKAMAPGKEWRTFFANQA